MHTQFYSKEMKGRDHLETKAYNIKIGLAVNRV
jgi:hypothetical protein